MAERDIVNRIIKYLKTVPQCFDWKQHGDMYGTEGIPNIIACIGGRFVAFEVKTPLGKLINLQEKTIQRIKDAKVKAFKVTSLDKVKTILENLEVSPYD